MSDPSSQPVCTDSDGALIADVLFWGDRFTDQARQSLRQAIAKLKRLFGDLAEDALLTDDDRVGLSDQAAAAVMATSKIVPCRASAPEMKGAVSRNSSMHG